MVATWKMLGWQGVDLKKAMQRTEECIKAAQYIVHGQDGAAGWYILISLALSHARPSRGLQPQSLTVALVVVLLLVRVDR